MLVVAGSGSISYASALIRKILPRKKPWFSSLTMLNTLVDGASSSDNTQLIGDTLYREKFSLLLPVPVDIFSN